MALAAAGASTAAHAATVQITFQNSFVSSTLGNQLINTDFGGDGFWEINAGARYADAVGVLAVDGVGGIPRVMASGGFSIINWSARGFAFVGGGFS
jgi:hypothetical protein